MVKPRQSFDRNAGQTGTECLGFQLSLGSRSGKVDNKSNEITAIPELLKLLEITGCIITIDAMGTQKAIAASIIDQKADYILALKGNQGNLHKAVKQWFEQARTQQFEGIEHSYYEPEKVLMTA